IDNNLYDFVFFILFCLKSVKVCFHVHVMISCDCLSVEIVSLFWFMSNRIRLSRAMRKTKCRMSILQSSSGIVDVHQQRLNCALPSHFSELWLLSIPKSSRRVREVIN